MEYEIARRASHGLLLCDVTAISHVAAKYHVMAMTNGWQDGWQVGWQVGW